MRIDCPSHIFPQAYAELLQQNRGLVRVTLREGGYRLSHGAIQKFVLDANAYSLEKKLRDMDAAQVDVSLLSVNMPGPEGLDRHLGSAAAEICNNALAEAVGNHSDRFGGIAASLPQLPQCSTGRETARRGIEAAKRHKSRKK